MALLEGQKEIALNRLTEFEAEKEALHVQLRDATHTIMQAEQRHAEFAQFVTEETARHQAERLLIGMRPRTLLPVTAEALAAIAEEFQEDMAV